jgi:hypothetical protein
MNQLKQFLQAQKPDASDKTIHGYYNNLMLLNKNMTNRGVFNFEDFNKFTTEELMDRIQKDAVGKSNSYTRNMLSALKAYSGDKKLTAGITAASLAEKIDIENRDASEYVKSHHLTVEMIDAKYSELEARAEPLWKLKEYTMDDFQKIQEFVMFAVESGKWIAPRRNMDWVLMKIRMINPDVDNYIKDKTFVFNQFKTSKKMGQQIIPIPPELYRIIRKWIKFNQLEHMFVTVNGEPLTSNSFSQKLNHAMGISAGRTGGYGCNNFRHSYLTNKYGNTIDLEKDLESMGSGMSGAKYYIKKI